MKKQIKVAAIAALVLCLCVPGMAFAQEDAAAGEASAADVSDTLQEELLSGEAVEIGSFCFTVPEEWLCEDSGDEMYFYKDGEEAPVLEVVFLSKEEMELLSGDTEALFDQLEEELLVSAAEGDSVMVLRDFSYNGISARRVRYQMEDGDQLYIMDAVLFAQSDGIAVFLYAAAGEETTALSMWEYEGILTSVKAAAEQEKAAEEIDVAEVIDTSIDVYLQDGAEEALSVIRAALKSLPEDEDLLAYQALYKTCLPTALSDIKLLEGSDYTMGTIEDYYGNVYDGYYAFKRSGLSNPVVHKYYLNGQYATFTTSYFTMYNSNFETQIEFKVLADDEVIYDSGVFTREQKLSELELDVTGVDVLTIESYLIKYNGVGSEPILYLIDATVQNVLTESDLR